MRYDHDNYEIDGRPLVFLNGEKVDVSKVIWADDMTGEVALLNLNHRSCRIDERGTILFNGLFMDRDENGHMVLPKIIKRGKVEFCPRDLAEV